MNPLACLGRLVGIVLGFTFVIFFSASVWVFNINRTALEAETYLETFADEDVYENLTPLILPAVLQGNESEVGAGSLSFDAVIENLDQDDWAEIAQEIIPPGYIQTEAENSLILFFDYMTGEQARLNVEFNTQILRDNLLGVSGDQMVNRIFNSWPPCSNREETQVAAFLDAETTRFTYCRPQDVELQRQVFAALSNAKDAIALDIPVPFNLRQQFAERNNVTLRETDVFYYETLQLPSVSFDEFAPTVFLMSAALLAMIMITSVTSTKSFFGWMGWPLILTGLVTLAPLSIVPLIISGINSESSSPPNDNLTALQEETFAGMISSLLSDFSMPILLQGAVLVGLGFLLVFLAILMPRHPNPTPEWGSDSGTNYQLPPPQSQG